MNWLKICITDFWTTSFKSFFNIYEVEALQGSFRFINNSISGPLLILYGFGCYLVYSSKKPEFIVIALIGAASPLMAFSYPSRALVAYWMLLGMTGFSLYRGKRQAAIVFLSIGFGTIGLLLIGGYIQFAHRVFTDNELWNNIFAKDTYSLINRPIIDMAVLVIINKYTISLFISILALWYIPDFRDFTIVVGSLACGLVVTGLFDMPMLWHRFLNRGVDHLWFLCFIVSLAVAWQRVTDKFIADINAYRLNNIILLVVFLIPTVCFGNYALASAGNLTRFMPEGRWEMLQWVKRNVSANKTIAALDWDDITFIPIYTKAKLAVDHMIIGGRSPVDEMKRYASIWKILGYEREILKYRLDTMLSTHMQRSAKTLDDYRNPPLTDPDSYASSQIAEALLYWPYVSDVNGIRIGAEKVSIDSNPQLVTWALSLFDSANPDRDIREMAINYVIISGSELKLKSPFNNKMRLVFLNQTHRIYAVE